LNWKPAIFPPFQEPPIKPIAFLISKSY
jgi:hypothetical protein